MKSRTLYSPLLKSAAVFLASAVVVLLLNLALSDHWQTIARFALVFPAIWLGYEAVCFLRTLDELQQKIALETLAFSMANTALVILAIGLLQAGSLECFNVLWILVIFALFGALGYRQALRRYG